MSVDPNLVQRKNIKMDNNSGQDPKEKLPLTDETESDTNASANKRACHCSKRMKCFTCLGISTIVLLLVAVGAACLFRNPTIFTYPLHASCNITWTFGQQCDTVRDKIVNQASAWRSNATCGTGQKCLYEITEQKDDELKGTHTTPKAGYIDDIEYKFYPKKDTGGCNVVGFSTSRIFFAILDFGTNYCNLHNLVDGAGLTQDPQYSELTRDEICTQYTSADCEKY